jgi:hypothetical protein
MLLLLPLRGGGRLRQACVQKEAQDLMGVELRCAMGQKEFWRLRIG